jgi:hypothetical protein
LPLEREDSCFTLTTKDYILNLYYGPGAPPLAEGGYTSFIPRETPGSYYEVHTFLESGSLSFVDTAKASITADYLIVAGGGGAGGNDASGSQAKDTGGGGGAGGLLYKTGQDLMLTGGFVTVKVGAGGQGGTARAQGADGGDSSIGSITVPGGGGGGAGNASSAYISGKPGGSGGGGGAGGGSAAGTPGNGRLATANGAGPGHPDVLGNDGGYAYFGTGSPNRDAGGGGGGAKGAGGSTATTGAGGAPWIAADEGAAWVSATAGGVNEFSRGGAGGGNNKVADGLPGANYGDGGSGSSTSSSSGGAGHYGIVIIRFPAQSGGTGN